MKNLISLILILFLQSHFFAGNNDKVKASVKNVSGKITSVNGEEISGAKIVIKETNETYFADIDGNFKFEVKTDKVYSVTIDVIGYSPLELRSTELSYFSELSLKEL